MRLNTTNSTLSTRTIDCQLVQCKCADEAAPNFEPMLLWCRPHPSLQVLELPFNGDRCSHSVQNLMSNLPPDYDKKQTLPLASLEAQWPAEQACRNVQRSAPLVHARE